MPPSLSAVRVAGWQALPLKLHGWPRAAWSWACMQQTSKVGKRSTDCNSKSHFHPSQRHSQSRKQELAGLPNQHNRLTFHTAV